MSFRWLVCLVVPSTYCCATRSALQLSCALALSPIHFLGYFLESFPKYNPEYFLACFLELYFLGYFLKYNLV